jgi:hypothetical protein
MLGARSLLALLSVLALGGLSACGSTHSRPPSPPAKLERVGPGSALSVVLTPQGMKRIGVQTARVSAVPGSAAGAPTAVVPYAAILYEPDGSPLVYTNPAPLIYTRVSISVVRIVGDRVYVTRGPAVGTRVVTVGGEELLGVQNGVGVQT